MIRAKPLAQNSASVKGLRSRSPLYWFRAFRSRAEGALVLMPLMLHSLLGKPLRGQEAKLMSLTWQVFKTELLSFLECKLAILVSNSIRSQYSDGMVTLLWWTVGGMDPRGSLGTTPITLLEKTRDFPCFGTSHVMALCAIVHMKMEYN